MGEATAHAAGLLVNKVWIFQGWAPGRGRPGRRFMGYEDDSGGRLDLADGWDPERGNGGGLCGDVGAIGFHGRVLRGEG